MRTPLALALAGTFGLLAACADVTAPLTSTPAAPAPAATTHQDALGIPLQCVGDLARHTVRCGAPPDSAGASTTAGGLHRAITFGGQGTYVQLAWSNVVTSTGVLEGDVAVTNLIPQTLGTTDGTTADGEGVRVFFTRLPVVTGGAGTVDVDNPDGFDTFTGANQPFYRYNTELGDGLLTTNEASASKRWRFHVSASVTTFTFTVYVSTNVRYPQGYIAMAGLADNQLTGTTSAVPTAVVHTALGDVVPGATVTYASSAPGVATVDPTTGARTAVAPGTTTITATSGSRLAAHDMNVCPALAVGETYTTSGSAARAICFDGGTSGQEYVAVPFNASGSSSVSLTATGTGIQAVIGPPTPSRSPAEAPFVAALGDGGALASGRLSAALSLGAPGLDASRVGDAHLARLLTGPIGSRARITRHPRMVWGATGGDALSARRSSGAQVVALGAVPTGPSYTITPGVPAVGSLMDLNAGSSSCAGTPSVRTGRVRTVSASTVIVADTANPAGGFTSAQYDSIALEIDTIAYAVDTTNFGAPTDRDANGRIVVFFTRAVNELSPPASSVVTNASFAARDLVSADPSTGCSLSNEGEIIYALVPDPTGAVNSNARTVSSVRGSIVRTVGHELQHLINASRRLYGAGNGPLEERWLDEAMSQVAEELMFFRTSLGLAPGSGIVVTSLTTGPNASRRVAAYNTYANTNFGMLRPALQRPDTVGPVKLGLAAQGAGWAFLRYLADRQGTANQAAFWRSLVDSPHAGRANLAAALGGIDLDQWQADFVTAMYAAGAGFTLSSQYLTPTWNYRNMYTALGGVPLLARPLTNGSALTLSYSRQGSSYLRFGVPASGFADFTLQTAGAAPPATVYLTVMRTK